MNIPNAQEFVVKPGSLIVLRDVPMAQEGAGSRGLGFLVTELRRISGHDQFVILSIPRSGTAEVIGPEELRSRLREALDAADDLTGDR